MTASHNPKEYNGYKVYGPNGGQITDETAAAIFREIQQCDMMTEVRFLDLSAAEQAGLLHWIGEDVDAPDFRQVEDLTMRRDLILSLIHILTEENAALLNSVQAESLTGEALYIAISTVLAQAES